jgi:hypothetical protein
MSHQKEPLIDVFPSEIKKADKRFLKLANNDILFKPPFTMACIGAIGSGKTSFVYTLINKLYKNYWDEVIVICGTLDSKKSWENINQRSILFLDVFDDDAIMEYVKEIEQEQLKREEDGKAPLRILMVLDDIVMEGINARRVGTLEKLTMTCRHYNISIILALQHSKQISAAMRNQIFHWIIFRLTANDLHKIAEEHGQLLNKDQFIKMYNDVQMNGKHEFLIIDYKKDIPNRFSHRFTKTINQLDYI